MINLKKIDPVITKTKEVKWEKKFFHYMGHLVILSKNIWDPKVTSFLPDFWRTAYFGLDRKNVFYGVAYVDIINHPDYEQFLKEKNVPELSYSASGSYSRNDLKDIWFLGICSNQEKGKVEDEKIMLDYISEYIVFFKYFEGIVDKNMIKKNDKIWITT